ncbi:hypothetical protein J1N35_023226 [Gossypium stocksii]|uniref:NADP-dependent oxidoreductase domain-containing protein n=1 Tax=Gossypium stocksii TaxID=47602 RepID=A0A9D3VHI3_9ROSI|nr:hypothetical protein J1N35_023226 [Gossypium stocksii]
MGEEQQRIQIPRVKLGTQGLEVSKLGFVCMGLTGGYSCPVSEEVGISIIKHAFHRGIIFFDTSDIYGPETNEILVGKVQLATKREGTVSLKCLDVDYIDLYYQHRVDTNTLIEDTVRLLQIRFLILLVVFYEGNLELGLFLIALLVAVSLVAKEWWKLCLQIVIWFQGENLDKNKMLYLKVDKLAEKHGCSPAQLALAWVLRQGDDVAPIPGTTMIKNLDSNIDSVKVKLTAEGLKEISDAVPVNEVAGDLFPDTLSQLHWKFGNTQKP